MSAVAQRAQARIRQIMRQFDSQRAVVSRPEKDEYGQPTQTEIRIGSAQVWRNAMAKPNKWQVSETGQIYDMDGMIWVCLLAPAPAIERGDVVTIGAERFKLRNSARDAADVRIYWQLQRIEP